MDNYNPLPTEKNGKNFSKKIIYSKQNPIKVKNFTV